VIISLVDGAQKTAAVLSKPKCEFEKQNNKYDIILFVNRMPSAKIILRADVNPLQVDLPLWKTTDS